MVIIKTTIIFLDIVGLHMSNILHSDICFFFIFYILIISIYALELWHSISCLKKVRYMAETEPKTNIPKEQHNIDLDSS